MTLGSTEHADFYGYNAESYNPNTGLEYLRARYYNANQGRFFQEDTYQGDITDPLTLNRYAYTKNSPMNYVDPSGYFLDWLFGGNKGSNSESTINSGSKKDKQAQDDYDRIMQGERGAEHQREAEAGKRKTELSKMNENIKELTKRYKKEKMENERIDLLKQMEKIMQDRESLCGGKENFDYVTPIISIPDELVNLLMQLELSKSPALTSNGVLNHDAGDGGVTVGIGVYVKNGSAGDETRKWLKDKYNVDASLGVLVDFDTVFDMFNETKYKYIDRVNKILLVRNDNNIKVKQQEFEAMFLLAYNTNILDLEPYLQQGSLDADTFARVMLAHYKSLSNWEKYKNGWSSRVKSAAYLFKTGQYEYLETTADDYLKSLGMS